MVLSRCSEKEGFTLIELIVAIMIIGIFMAVVGPRFIRWIGRGEETRAKQELLGFKQTITEYKFDVKDYPNALADLVRRPSGSAGSLWKGPYIDEEKAVIIGNSIADPWGQPYRYRITKGGKHPFDLYSDGNPDKPQKIDVWEIK